MPILYALALAQAVQPSMHHADHPADHQSPPADASSQQCTNPTAVIPPFNNSPGAVAQSEAATKIVLATRDGQEAFPEVDPSVPVCSTFSIDDAVADGDEQAIEEVAVGGDLEAAGEASEETSD